MNSKPITLNVNLETATAEYKRDFDVARIGSKVNLPVAVCASNRVACDPISQIVKLPCTKIMREYQSIQAGNTYMAPTVIVHCPRHPKGFHPGVYAGIIPIIAARDMRPAN